MVEGERLMETTIEELMSAFPAAFMRDPSRVRPLKLGIRDDIYERSGISHRRIIAALRSYCSSTEYLTATKEGAARIDLDGESVGVVTATEAEHAARALQRMTKMAAKRTRKSAAALAPRRLGLNDLRAAARARKTATGSPS